MYYNTKTYDCLGKINRKNIKQSKLEIENRIIMQSRYELTD